MTSLSGRIYVLTKKEKFSFKICCLKDKTIVLYSKFVLNMINILRKQENYRICHCALMRIEDTHDFIVSFDKER